MRSGSVNASMLLAQVLEGEHGKIGYEIANSDFAGELQKLLPQKGEEGKSSETSKIDNPPSDLNPTPDSLKALGTARKASSEQASEPIGQVRSRRASTGPKEKIDALKIRAKNSRSLFITNPVLTESVLAGLHYPADTIKTAKSMQTRQGWISLKDFKALIQNRPAPPAAAAQGRVTDTEVWIPAEQAQAIIAAIVEKSPGSGQTTSKPLKDGLSKPVGSVNGYYTLGEFRALLDRVLDQANAAKTGQQEGEGASPKLHNPVAEAGQTRISGQVEVAPRQGQTESIAATVLPPFISDDPEGKEPKKTQSGTAREWPARSGKLSPDIAAIRQEKAVRPASAEKVYPSGEGGKKVPGVMPERMEIAANHPESFGQAGDRDRDHFPGDGVQAREPAANTSAAPPAANAAAVDVKGSGFPPILTVPASDGQAPGNPAQSAPPDNVPRAAAGAAEKLQVTQCSASMSAAQENPILYGQGVAAVAKDMKSGLEARELQTDGASFQVSSNHFPGTRIEMSQTQQAPGDGFSYYDPERSAEIAQYYRGQNSPGTVPERMEVAATHPESFGQAGDRDRSSRDAIQAREPAANTSAAEHTVKATTVDVKSLGLPPILTGAASTGEEGLAQEDPAQSAPPDKVLRAAAGAAEQLRVTQCSISRSAEQDKPTLYGQGVAAVAKEMKNGLKARELHTDAASFQVAPNHFQGSRIEMSQMQQAPGDGFGYYDQGRSAEIVRYYREHFAGIGGKHLVLEMEPDEFGKLSIKIGAKRDEISAMVLTENEPARQALMKNSPELRQDFQDQGLMLGKFEVGVNRENAGRESCPESQKHETASAPPTRKPSNSPAPLPARPAYPGVSANLSRVSIFA